MFGKFKKADHDKTFAYETIETLWRTLQEEDDDVVEQVATTKPTVEVLSRPKRRVNWMDSTSTEQVAGNNESTSGSLVTVTRLKRAKPIAPPLQQLVE